LEMKFILVMGVRHKKKNDFFILGSS